MNNLRRLGSLTTKVGSGATPRGGKAVYTNHGAAFIRSQNVLDNAMSLDDIARITDEAARQLKGVTVEPGDVLLNITGDSIARACVVDPAVLPARVSQHVAIIRTSEDLDSRFLQRFLVHPGTKRHLLAISDGGTRKALTKAHIQGLMVPVPPIERQRAIAEVLGALDDKIAANSRLIASAEALMITSAALAMGMTTVGSLAAHSTAALPPDRFDEEVAHFSLPAFDVDARPDVTTGASIKSNKFLVDQPSVLMSKLNPRIPRVWNVPALPSHMALASTEFVVLRPQSLDPSVLWATLARPEVSSSLNEKVGGTSGSHQRVKPAELMSLPIRDPRSLPADTLKAIASLGLVVHARREERAQLGKLRDALLPELISGKVTIKDAERVVEGVL